MLTDRFSATPSLFGSAALDFEPFEVVCQMLKGPKRARTIGGAPQLVKVYEHLNTQPFAVKMGSVWWGSISSGPTPSQLRERGRVDHGPGDAANRSSVSA